MLRVPFILLIWAVSNAQSFFWPSMTRPSSYNNWGTSLPDHGQGVIVMNSSTSVCDFTSAMGPSCNLTGVDEVFVIPGGIPPFDGLEIEVHNASSMILYPTCISWVQIKGVKKLSTANTKDDFAQKCNTWLRASETHIDSLEHGLRDVTLLNSSVDHVNLKDLNDFLSIDSNITLVEHLEWATFGAIFVNTNIEIIERMISKDRILLKNVRIENIRSEALQFSHDLMTVNQTTVRKIESKGIQITSGKAVFINSRFIFVDEYGLSANVDAFLQLNNVTIDVCVKPCIVVSDPSYLAVTNVTIEGRDIREVPESILYLSEEVSKFPRLSKEQKDNCHNETDDEEAFVCDFSSIDQESYFSHKFNNASLTSLTIMNAQYFHIKDLCARDIILLNSNGSYINGLYVDLSYDCKYDDTNTTFSAQNTTFKQLESAHLYSMTLKKSSAVIANVAKSELVSLESVKIDHMFLQTYTAMLKSVNISFYLMLVRGNLEVHDSYLHIYDLGFLVTPNTGFVTNGTVTNSTMVLEQTSLNIKGNFQMRDVLLKVPDDTDHYHISLFEGARLSLTNVVVANNRTKVVVKVETIDQVLSDSTNMTDFIIKLPNATDSIISPNNRFCNNSMNSNHLIFCDFQKTDIDVKIERLAVSHVIISNAKNLSIEDACTVSLNIIDVDFANNENDNNCLDVYGSLRATNTTFGTMYTRPETQLIRSRVKSLKSVLLFRYSSSVYIKSSTIDEIQLESYDVKISDSKVGNIVNSTFWLLYINNTSVTTIQNVTALHITDIRDCTIDEISYFSSFLLVMKNVHIKKVVNQFVIPSFLTASVYLENVTIDEGPNNFLSSLSAKSTHIQITVINVTLGGKPWHYEDSATIKSQISTEVTSSTSSTATTYIKTEVTTEFIQNDELLTDDVEVIENDADSRIAESSIGEKQVGVHTWLGAIGVMVIALLCLGIVTLSVLSVRNYKAGRPILPRIQDLFKIGSTESDETEFATEFNLGTNPNYSRLSNDEL